MEKKAFEQKLGEEIAKPRLNEEARAELRVAIRGAIETIIAVADAIQELKSIPSGHLYAVLMDRLSLDQYSRIIETLENGKLIEVSNHLITWKGPEREKPPTTKG
jgi:hypothetical protein